MNSENIQVEIFGGQLTPESAQVFVRATGAPARQGVSICGHLRGPLIAERRTLPTTAPLVDLGPGDVLLASARIVDPVFWSPANPALYDAVVEIRGGDELLHVIRRRFGVRSIATRGRDFLMEGKRWVLRAAALQTVDQRDLELLREQSLALVLPRPSDDVCNWASHEGLFIVARVDCETADLEDELRRLARHAAVGVVALEGDVRADFPVQSCAPNLLPAQPFSPGEAASIAPWAKLIVCSAEGLANFTEAARKIQLPVIALRQESEPIELDRARAACDRLQRDLAPIGDFAGYVVDLGSKHM